MRCKNCGAIIPDGSIHCENCGVEFQIVPDYSPLDDVLAAQVRSGISQRLDEGEDMEDPAYDRVRQTARERQVTRNMQMTRDREVTRDSQAARDRQTSRDRQAARDRQAGRNSREQMTDRERAKEKRRRQEERRRELAKKKKQKLLMIGGIVLVVAILLGVILYQNSYTGQVRKGYKALDNQKYNVAIEYFQKAIKKKEEKPDAYTGLSKVYIAQDDYEKSENVFINALAGQPSNAELYRATIQFYLDTNQEEKVSSLLDSCSSDTVLKQLEEYVSDVPQFSLEEEMYEDVQELTLSTSGKTIYYTTDGTEPTTSSTKYVGPIQLSEGTTVVKAIAVNAKGIPSLVAEKSYTVELPTVDAPSVSPSTGQYFEPTQITIQVPNGYEAYYTTDRSTPTSSSKRYTGPIDMPEGSTFFSAVLINSKGKASAVTKRSYELTIEEPEEEQQ